MAKWWCILFGGVNLACLGLFLVAPFVDGWWMLPGLSEHSGSVDNLFYVILYITAFFFILTEALLAYFILKYGARPAGQPVPTTTGLAAKLVQPLARYFNTSKKIEMGWTIIPAAILLFIAIAQIGAWEKIKYQKNMPAYGQGDTPVQVAVSARQFEWRVRYPGPERWKDWVKKNPERKKDFAAFGKNPEYDDVHLVNEVHVIKGRPALVHLSTRDVIHSFNLPQMRIKQDALPGRTIPVWFTPTKANAKGMAELKKKEGELAKEKDAAKKEKLRGEIHALEKEHVWELACAELCGWGHFRMIGRLYVHENEPDFTAWLHQAYEHHRTVPGK